MTARLLSLLSFPVVLVLAVLCFWPTSFVHAVPLLDVCKEETWDGSKWNISKPEVACDDNVLSPRCLPYNCEEGAKMLRYRCATQEGASQVQCQAALTSNGTSNGEDGGGATGTIPSGEITGDVDMDSDDGDAQGIQTIQVGRTGTISLDSPINCEGQPCTIPFIIARIINFILSGIGAVAVLMLVLAGITYMTSAGNEKRTAAAKQTILYTIIGLAVVFFALVIVRFTIRLIGA